MSHQPDEFGLTAQQAERLRAEMARLRPRLDVPAELDDAIIAAARRHLTPAARPLRWRAAAGWAAAAATLGFAVWFATSGNQHQPAQTIYAARESADLDASGRVDILDAFKLARQLNGAPSAEPVADGSDINQDGEINQSDVEALAMMAVDLQRSSS